jgi:uncharacterized Zn finger protein (UPF0148 family)
MTTHPSCPSCGMPLRTAADHATGDVSNPYCVHCADASGRLKSYDDVRAGMSRFMQRTQGIAPAVAHEMAGRMMAGLPAWRDRA